MIWFPMTLQAVRCVAWTSASPDPHRQDTWRAARKSCPSFGLPNFITSKNKVSNRLSGRKHFCFKSTKRSAENRSSQSQKKTRFVSKLNKKIIVFFAKTIYLSIKIPKIKKNGGIFCCPKHEWQLRRPDSVALLRAAHKDRRARRDPKLSATGPRNDGSDLGWTSHV